MYDQLEKIFYFRKTVMKYLSYVHNHLYSAQTNNNDTCIRFNSRTYFSVCRDGVGCDSTHPNLVDSVTLTQLLYSSNTLYSGDDATHSFLRNGRFKIGRMLQLRTKTYQIGPYFFEQDRMTLREIITV